MALTRLRLSHFRSHVAAALDLDGRPVAVFGPNGAGKTNLIEAISLLSPGRGLRGAAPDDLARRPEAIGWKVTAAVAAPDGPHEIATWSEGAGRRVEIDGKAASQTALGGALRVLWLTPAMDRLWTEGAAERRRFLDRTTLSLIPEHGEVALSYDRALRERNRLIRDGVRDPGWFAALEDTMATAGARLAAHRAAALARLAAVAADPAFPRAELAIEGEGPREAAGLREALREGRGRDLAAGRTLVGPHRDDLGAVYAAKGVAARLCSTGEQKALLVSLVLANARAVAEGFGRAPVLLLDEITAHLDEGRRASLFRAVEALGAQAFMTGTGPELFEGIDAQRVAVGEAGLGPG
ncbi:MAG: DNA replication/repair protein RecF [Amaricoccus sp.]|uniref:DNA replication/repair protein RecF n=1 Tax=Amaricoccus sp. TaxID=1872485 RepID=UPI0039E54404